MNIKRYKKILILPLLALVFWLGTAFKDDYFEITKQIEIFTSLYKTVNSNYVEETNPTQMMNTAIKSMLKELDPYTVYFSEQDAIKFKINNTGEYTGIGAVIQRKEGKVIIKEPYKDYPADKAGLKAGDEIFQIDDINLTDYKEDISTLLRGAKNAEKVIHYTRQGKKQKTTLILNEVDIEAVPYYGMIDDNTGYIVLTAFNRKTTTQTKNAVVDLKAKGAKQLVLDLRGNPGGLLMEAVNICNLFVPKDKLIVTTKSKNDRQNVIYKTRNEPLDIEIPLAIIIDGKSASASEIVSGALQDLDRAVVIGAKSFGKGLVQRPLDLIYGTQVKVTIAKYYTPSGRCIQAIDYANRDEAGQATKIDDTKKNEFKTSKGRKVFDGGGINPDVVVADTELSAITKILIDNDAIFNFATQWYYTNNLPENSLPTIGTKELEEFKTFLKTEKISLNTQTEKAIKRIESIAAEESLDEFIKNDYKKLLQSIENSNNYLVDKNKDQILKLIKEELIKRYQYRQGLYEYFAKNSQEVLQAKKTLSTSEYQKILKL